MFRRIQLRPCVFLLWLALPGCSTSQKPPAADSGSAAAPPDSAARAAKAASDSVDAEFEGVDSRGVPHYAVDRTFSPQDSVALRRAYGIEDPHRLYISDSTELGIVRYDTQVKRCPSCYVNSYRVGYVSVRRPDESWEQAERRVKSTKPQVFTGSPRPSSVSISDMDPDVQALVRRMLDSARAAGFKLRVTATYRSPLREAFLMARGGGRTHTLTSSHSYGRAIDIVDDDGNRAHKKTKADWIAFRQWVTHYPTGSPIRFHILGRSDYSWDWQHIELPVAHIGFRTIEAAIAQAHACTAPAATTPCDFAPHLP